METINRLDDIMNELHDIANSYAGEKTGTEASLLHLASGNIQTVLESLNSGKPLDAIEVSHRYLNWSNQLLMLKLLKL
jgi:hypothetical protein